LEFIYDTGKRDLAPEEDGGAEIELAEHRFTAQYARGLGQGFELLFRGSPATNRISVNGSGFNPEVWSVGGGIHWAPPENLGPVRVGLSATVDYQDGRSSGDNQINWLEMGMAAGLSVPLPRDLSVTGGLSLSRADVRFKTAGEGTDYSLAEDTGGFLGAGWSPGPAWNISTEVHVGSERVWGLSARYNFQ
jgi:hypothetical protein